MSNFSVQLTNLFQDIWIGATALLLVGYFFLPNKRNLVSYLLKQSNLFLGFTGILATVFWLIGVVRIFLSDDLSEKDGLINRMTSSYAFIYWIEVAVVCFLPCFFRIPTIQSSILFSFLMWLLLIGNFFIFPLFSPVYFPNENQEHLIRMGFGGILFLLTLYFMMRIRRIKIF